LKESNPWGLFDLYGNVSEWCLDDALPHDVLEDGAVDPVKKHEKGLEPNKVARGGDYYAPAKLCRSASRIVGMKDNPFNDPIGLRIVCVAK
jgi:formylglycine-generating enzyme required for sulfatase activity